MDPLTFTPYYRPRVWGGRTLAEQFGRPLPSGEPFGEAWEISVHPLQMTPVACGPHAGRTLNPLLAEYWRELTGLDGVPPMAFPLLIKLLDCQDRLSVQVHPTDGIAHRLRLPEPGKTEAWVILEAAPDARLYAGFKHGIDSARVQEALSDDTVIELLHEIRPRAGDCFFIPAGTVHALGGGLVLAEVQQSSDATYRLFDWNRPGTDGLMRPLHVQESLISINWHIGPIEPLRLPRPVAIAPRVLDQSIIDCAYFTLHRWLISGIYHHPDPHGLVAAMCLEGRVLLERPETGYRHVLGPGDTVLVPAGSTGLIWSPLAETTAQLLQIVPKFINTLSYPRLGE